MQRQNFTMSKADKLFKKEEVIAQVRENYETMLAIDINGVIQKCVTINSKLTVDDYFKLITSDKNKECSISFILRDENFNETMLYQKIHESVDALEYAKAHELRPGVNFPGAEYVLDLKPEEKRLIGRITEKNGLTELDFVSQRIQYLIEKTLIKLVSSKDGEEILFRDKNDGRYWEKTHSKVERAPMLIWISEEEAREKYKF